MPLTHRKAGLYKQKRFSNQELEAIQVLGAVHHDETSGSKKIFLGSSLSASFLTDTFYLEQACPQWDQDAGDWDRGVELKKSSTTSSVSSSPIAHQPHFGVVWRRMAGRAGCIGPDIVPGTVREKLSVTVSAVLLRGPQLVSTTSFCLPMSPSFENLLSSASTNF